MPTYNAHQQSLLDSLQRNLDLFEKKWPMTGSFARIDPYIIPFNRGYQNFQLIIYHFESKSWYDNDHVDHIMNHMVDRRLIAPGEVAFDLGCNSGTLALIMAKLCGPEGHVHGFDPFPWNVIATTHNARLNGFANVTAHAVGLSNRRHRIRVRPKESTIYKPHFWFDSKNLEIHSISDFMYLKPSFLKLDIEGSEHEVFDQLDARVFDCVRFFSLEFHPYFLRPRGIDPKITLRNIQRMGFDLHYHSVENPAYDPEQFDDSHHVFWGVKHGVALPAHRAAAQAPEFLLPGIYADRGAGR